VQFAQYFIQDLYRKPLGVVSASLLSQFAADKTKKKGDQPVGRAVELLSPQLDSKGHVVVVAAQASRYLGEGVRLGTSRTARDYQFRCAIDLARARALIERRVSYRSLARSLARSPRWPICYRASPRDLIGIDGGPPTRYLYALPHRLRD